MTCSKPWIRTLAIAVGVAGSSLSWPSTTYATHCIGRVVFVEAYRDGNLMVGLQGDGVRINRGILCNLRNQLGPVLPESCRMWASFLQAGKLSGKSVDVYVTGDLDDMSKCVDNGDNTTLWFDRVESVSLY